MGHLGDPEHPEVQSAIEEAIGKIVSAGRVPGTLVNDGNLQRYVQMGVKFLMTSWNGWVARGATEFVQKAASA
jgi:2-keto-3-deoxy-L-rhamnonate aldolase RhmA